tara:strand:- start:460 stop:852 length:393 start_codon:yes stop_codon:yes gene_type:complete
VDKKVERVAQVEKVKKVEKVNKNPDKKVELVDKKVARVAQVKEIDKATVEYVRLIQSAFKSIGQPKMDKLKKAGSKKGLHNVSTILMKKLINRLKCAPPTDRQMAAILKDAGVDPSSTSMTWSEFYLWLS